MLKLKFIRNKETLNVTNNAQQTVIFDPKEIIGIPVLRSFAYYEIKQGLLLQNVSTYYHFETDALCEQFNIVMHTLKKEKVNKLEDDARKKRL